MNGRAPTYRELLQQLQTLPPERLDDTATVYVTGVDEFYPVMKTEVATSSDNDVLDEGHFFLVI